jgi:glycosyltransferase involved in cell wall biosynthesis
MPAVSIIIRAKNEERYIGDTLRMVYSQTVDDLETILVDSGSTDHTVEVAQEFPIKLVSIRPEDFTFGYSLNVGCQAAAGKYLALLSAHAVPCNEDWLSNLLQPFQDPWVAGVWGSDHTRSDNVATLTGRYRETTILDSNTYHPNNAAWGFAASNAAILREVWSRRQFDELLVASEDKDWAWWAIQSGYKIFYQPSAAVYHEHSLSLKQAYRRAWREHYAYAQVMPGLKFDLFDFLHNLLERPRGGLWLEAASMRSSVPFLAKLPYLLHRFAVRLALNIGRYQGLRQGKAENLVESRTNGVERA